MPAARRIVVVLAGRVITYCPLDEASYLQYEWQGDRLLLTFPHGGKCDESGAFAKVSGGVVSISLGGPYVALIEE